MMHTYCCDGGATILEKQRKCFDAAWEDGARKERSAQLNGFFDFSRYQSKSQHGGQYFRADASSKQPAFACFGLNNNKLVPLRFECIQMKKCLTYESYVGQSLQSPNKTIPDPSAKKYFSWFY